MDYEEKYNAALERAKEYHDNGGAPLILEVVFPELKESEDEKMRKSIIYALQNGGFYSSDKTDEAIAWLEKQGEQKTEPKFHPGDWITHNTANFVFKIINVGSNGYEVVNRENYKKTISFDNEGNYRLWTIEDAKDGDVLVASDGSIFLFAGVDDCACKYYIALTTDNCLKINKEVKGGYWETSRAVYPATKEQRDLLFQKMADAGYEFVNGHITRF